MNNPTQPDQKAVSEWMRSLGYGPGALPGYSRTHDTEPMYEYLSIEQATFLYQAQQKAVAEAEKTAVIAMTWLLGNDTGTSSKTICAHMLGVKMDAYYMSPPSDASDRGRCTRLLQRIPEWIPRLDEMADMKDQTIFTINNQGVREEYNSWARQVPLLKAELKQLTSGGGEETK